MSEDLERFVALHMSPLLRFSFLLTHDARLAEDLVQDVFAEVARRWPEMHQIERPDAYLRKMVVNAATSWSRRARNREIPVTVTESAVSVPDTADAMAARDEMWTLLATLPARQRAVLVLRYYEGLSDQEISAVLGCSGGNARSLASRALATLRTRTQSLLTDVGGDRAVPAAPGLKEAP
jgi:RNA polymerase sigma-70 factor (sigma-E family)